jgi:putative hemolysin
VVSWLKKTLHQDEVNRFLTGRAAGKYGKDFLDECVDYLEMDLTVKGLDELPTNEGGRYFTIVSNHPLGGEDGVALGKLVCRKWDSQMVYLVNDVLMNLHGLAPLCVPVNKVGKQSRGLPQAIDAAFSGDYHMFVFPAGLCSRRIDGEIRDLPWQKTFIQKSVQYHRDVVPMHFNGRNSERFYRIANICKALHSPINIAMLYLADELFKNTNKTFELTIGKPIPWQTFDKTRTPSQWAQWVRNEVYNLVK